MADSEREKGRRMHFKNLRKEQKRKRAERKREEQRRENDQLRPQRVVQAE